MVQKSCLTLTCNDVLVTLKLEFKLKILSVEAGLSSKNKVASCCKHITLREQDFSDDCNI